MKENLQELLNNYNRYFWSVPTEPPLSSDLQLGVNHEGQLIFKYQKETDSFIIDRNIYTEYNDAIKMTSLPFSSQTEEYLLIRDLTVKVIGNLINDEYRVKQRDNAPTLISNTTMFINSKFNI